MRSLRDNVLRSRWLQVAEHMKEQDLGAMMLTDLADVRWLTGFTGSNAAALAVADGPPLLATDARYAEQAAQECPESELLVTRDLIEQLLLRLREHNASSLAVDPDSLSLAQFRVISAHPSLFGIKMQEVPSPLADMRTRKDLHEMEALSEACRISTEALGLLVPDIAVGQTEIQVARRLESLMGDLGSEDRSFPTIVATGPNGGEPHHAPTERPLSSGDLLTIDFGALVDGYHADCTRTFIVDAEPEDWQLTAFEAVAKAAAAGRAAVGPGVPATVVDAAARQVITDAGLGEYFVHGVGHGIGLDVHEAPMLGSASTGTLTVGVPFTVEPGVYLPDRGGVRIEDTCVLRSDGLEILTDFPRDLIRVG